MSLNKFLEWGGVITAILYSLLIAFNIDAEFIGFSLLLVSAIFITFWSLRKEHKGILFLQLFYIIAAIIGMYRWLD